MHIFSYMYTVHVYQNNIPVDCRVLEVVNFLIKWVQTFMCLFILIRLWLTKNHQLQIENDFQVNAKIQSHTFKFLTTIFLSKKVKYYTFKLLIDWYTHAYNAYSVFQTTVGCS